MISPGTASHGRGTALVVFPQPRGVLLVPAWGVSPGGLSGVPLSQRWSGDALGAPASRRRAGLRTHTLAQPGRATFVLPVRKESFQK